MVDQVGRGLRHAPHSARGAKPSALAAEGDEFVVAAVAAAQAQEAVRQDAALEEGVEFVLDELRQAGAGGLLGLGEEGLGVLMHQAVQRRLLRAVALVVVVERGTIRRPVATLMAENPICLTTLSGSLLLMALRMWVPKGSAGSD